MKRYSSHFPDPVVLVTVATDAHTNVMTVGWVTPVSFAPPILMVSIAPERFTHDLMIEAGEFGVSVLADDQKKLSTIAGTQSGKVIDKFDRTEFETIASEIISAPLIKGARAWYECKLVSQHSIGDHTAFFGEVVRSDADETKSPLILFNRKYYSLGEELGVYP
jgi:flavin reductase (DIM6/NTAB) family NADH-FMN oxidoreductase RutF